MKSKIIRADGTSIYGIKSDKYTEQVNADIDLRPGCVSSASIEVEVYGGQNNAVESGEELKYYRVDSDGNDVLFGVFYAEPTIKTRSTYSFTAYDNVSKLDVDFSARLASIQNDFPMPLSDLVGEACSVAGVTLSGSFPLSDLEVQAFYSDGITCRQILSWAAEIACRFVRCDTDGNIIFDWYERVTNYQIAPGDGQRDGLTNICYKQDGLHYENYSTEYLDNVSVRPSGTDGVAYIYPTVEPDDVYAEDENNDGNLIVYNVSVTDDDGNITFISEIDGFDDGIGNITIRSQSAVNNVFVISNNLLLNNAEAITILTVAKHVYKTLREIGIYRPAQISLFPFKNPFRAGQIVDVTDIQGVSFKTLIMSMAVSDSVAQLASTGGKTYNDSGYVSLQNQLINLFDNVVKINKLKVDWAEIGTAIIDVLQATNVTAQNLTVKAANIQGTLTIGQLPSSVAEAKDIPTKVSELTNDAEYQNATQVTTITESTIATTNVTAQNLTVKAANIQGALTVTDGSGNTVFQVDRDNGTVYLNADYIESGTFSSVDENGYYLNLGAGFISVNGGQIRTVARGALIRDLTTAGSFKKYNGTGVQLLLPMGEGNFTTGADISLKTGMGGADFLYDLSVYGEAQGSYNIEHSLRGNVSIGNASTGYALTVNGTNLLTALGEKASASSVFHGVGDTISGSIPCTGFLTGSKQNVYLYIRPYKMLPEGRTLRVTSLTASIRVPEGGYLVGDGSDLTAYIQSATRRADGSVRLLLTDSGGWAGSGGSLSNNIPLTGVVTIAATVI